MPATDAGTVERAEAAWLQAMTATGPDAMRRLMHPECLVIHAGVGPCSPRGGLPLAHSRHGPDHPDRGTRRHRAPIRRAGDRDLRHEMHLAYIPGLTPFVIQATATRVWVLDGSGWKLGPHAAIAPSATQRSSIASPTPSGGIIRPLADPSPGTLASGPVQAATLSSGNDLGERHLGTHHRSLRRPLTSAEN